MIRWAGFALALACTGCGGGAVVVENVAAATEPALNLTPVAPVTNVVATPEPANAAIDLPLNETELQDYPEARGMPADVQRFLVRRQECEHWTGEEPYDEARRAEIETNVAALCTGIDLETAALLERHANDPAVSAVLGRLDRIGM